MVSFSGMGCYSTGMSKTIVILAAGLGSRYGGLKQMDPVGPSGEFMIDYSVYDAIHTGFDRAVFVIRSEMEEDFHRLFVDRLACRIETENVYQELFPVPEGYFVAVGRKKPWGTGHAVLKCSAVIDGPFAVINADDFYGREAFEKTSRFLDDTVGAPDLFGMVGYRIGETLSEHGPVARGICRLGADGMLASIVERTHVQRADGQIQFEVEAGRCSYLSGAELVSMNMWALKPMIFKFLDGSFREFLETLAQKPDAEFFLPSVINSLISAGKASVRVMDTRFPWFGITNPQDKALARARIRDLVDRGIYPESLWQ